MLSILKKILNPEKASEDEVKRKIHIAAAALYIDMAKADTDYSDDEKEKIFTILKDLFQEDEEYIRELMTETEQELKKSISVYEFGSVLNENFSAGQKYQLLKNLWKIIFTDDTVDIYEEHLIKQIAGTLNLDRQDVIAAKFEVKKEMDEENK